MSQLKELPQWVGHTVKKVPLNPHTGKAAQSNNPETWGTAAEAWAAKKRHGWPGISFAFTRTVSVGKGVAHSGLWQSPPLGH